MTSNAGRTNLVLRLGGIVLEGMCDRTGLRGKENDRQKGADSLSAVLSRERHDWEY